MVDFIKRLFCKHDWEFIKEIAVYEDESKGGNPYEIRHVYVCKNCLKAKRIRL